MRQDRLHDALLERFPGSLGQRWRRVAGRVRRLVVVAEGRGRKQRLERSQRPRGRLQTLLLYDDSRRPGQLTGFDERLDPGRAPRLDVARRRRARKRAATQNRPVRLSARRRGGAHLAPEVAPRPVPEQRQPPCERRLELRLAVRLVLGTAPFPRQREEEVVEESQDLPQPRLLRRVPLGAPQRQQHRRARVGQPDRARRGNVHLRRLPRAREDVVVLDVVPPRQVAQPVRAQRRQRTRSGRGRGCKRRHQRRRRRRRTSARRRSDRRLRRARPGSNRRRHRRAHALGRPRPSRATVTGRRGRRRSRRRCWFVLAVPKRQNCHVRRLRPKRLEVRPHVFAARPGPRAVDEGPLLTLRQPVGARQVHEAALQRGRIRVVRLSDPKRD